VNACHPVGGRTRAGGVEHLSRTHQEDAVPESLTPLALFVAVQSRILASGDRERGDVPGWVLITLMTAGLVTVLWAVAGPKLRDILSSALDSVKGPAS
jgi:hypothetical protein